jgi:hypothetical protein
MIPQRDDLSEHDRSLKQAEQEAQRDFARLAHLHDISWSVHVFEGTIRFYCACSGRPFTAVKLDKHLLEMATAARIPKRR